LNCVNFKSPTLLAPLPIVLHMLTLLHNSLSLLEINEIIWSFFNSTAFAAPTVGGVGRRRPVGGHARGRGHPYRAQPRWRGPDGREG